MNLASHINVFLNRVRWHVLGRTEQLNNGRNRPYNTVQVLLDHPTMSNKKEIESAQRREAFVPRSFLPDWSLTTQVLLFISSETEETQLPRAFSYGMNDGFWRLHDLFNKYGISVTLCAEPSVLAKLPSQLEAIQQAKWEIAPKISNPRVILEELRLHRELTGSAPSGVLMSEPCLLTCRPEVLSKVQYITAGCGDAPYWLHLDRDERPPLNILNIPFSPSINDLAISEEECSSKSFCEHLSKTFDKLSREEVGVRNTKVLTIMLHSHMAGRPAFAESLGEFFENKNVQACCKTRRDIASFFHQHAQPMPVFEPSKLSRYQFADIFGAVFERSQWLAERAHAYVSPAHNSPPGVHNAMCRAFRSATVEERMLVVRAHPDLAGKLKAAERLSDYSSEEQSSMGLDALTDAEREQFTTLNQRYKDTHRFPFIIAVRNYTRQQILEEFERRVNNATAKESEEACSQVEAIARLRIEKVFQEQTRPKKVSNSSTTINKD